jgi:hypothetical protein
VKCIADSSAERQFLPEVEEVRGGLLLGDWGYFSRAYLRSLDQAGGFFIVRAAPAINPLIVHAIGPNGQELNHYRNKRLKEVAGKLSRFEHLDMKVLFPCTGEPLDCRLVVHPNLRKDDTPRYLVTNLEPEAFTPQHVSDGYRLRWQVELLFKEWKSYANLHAFDTSNPPALMHDPGHVHRCVKRALAYLASNAQRAHPDRDRQTGRLKLGLDHLYRAA